MKLPLRQLRSHLQQSLASIYLVATDEPLLGGEAADDIRAAAAAHGFDEREIHVVERGFRWDQLLAAADSLSLFASKRIVELRLATPRPGDAGAKAIRELAESDDPDRLVLVSIQAKLDAAAARSVWAKTVEQRGVVVEIWPVARAELPRWIGERARRRSLSLSADAAELLADRVEGNLLAADQELAKLALIRDDGRVDADAVLEAVASSARFDVFRLTDAVVAGDLPRALAVLDGLRIEGVQATLISWALSREIGLLARLKRGTRRGDSIDQLLAQERVWRTRQAAIKRAVARYSDAELAALLARAVDVDRAVKGLDRTPVWQALTGLVLAALAPPRQRATA